MMRDFYHAIMPVENGELENRVKARLDDLTKPPSSLGRLEEFVLRYCLCRGNAGAVISKKSLYVFAGDHGITAEGISPYPKEVTVQMVLNMLAGGAAISVMCRNAGIVCRVIDMGVDGIFEKNNQLMQYKVARGTQNFLRDCAMSEQQCKKAVDSGLSIAQSDNSDICAIGEMGIGNTSSASALYALLYNKDGASTVGRGTGADGELLEKKRLIVDDAVRFHRAQWDGTPLDAIRRVGGFEIAGMTGFILGCAAKRVPVVVDGFIATSAALCAIRIASQVKQYLFFGHVSNEQFHRNVLDEIGVCPILTLDMRLGEGTGAALAIQIIEQALNCYHEMATFSSAGVSNRDS